jgi:hypothetical protein
MAVRSAAVRWIGCGRNGARAHDASRAASHAATPLREESEQPAVKKSEIIEILEEQPEEVDVEKFIYALWLRRKIEAALVSPEDDDIPHEEVERMIDEWLASPGHRER